MDAIRQLAAVAGVLLLLLAVLWGLRRRGFAVAGLRKKPAQRSLESLERLPLGPQHTLHLIRLGETRLLLATSPAGCSLVSTVPGEAAQ